MIGLMAQCSVLREELRAARADRDRYAAAGKAMADARRAFLSARTLDEENAAYAAQAAALAAWDALLSEEIPHG